MNLKNIKNKFSILKEKKIVFWLLISFVLGMLFSTVFYSSKNETSSQETHSEADGHDHKKDKKEEVWTCSMHPQIKLPKKGKCPICNSENWGLAKEEKKKKKK